MKQTKYDKLDESDGQMVIRIAKKFVVIFVILFMFDFLLDLFSTLLDFFIEFLHLIIDFFEYSLGGCPRIEVVARGSYFESVFLIF